MANAISRALLLFFFVSTLLSLPATWKLINFFAVSVNPITYTAAYLLKLMAQLFTDLLTSVSQAIAYLGLPLTIACSLVLGGTLGILAGAPEYGFNTPWYSIMQIPDRSIYTLLHHIIHGLTIGMEVFIILCINVGLFLPFASLRWIFEQPARIQTKLRAICLILGAMASAWIENLPHGIIVDRIVLVVTRIFGTLCHWRRQGYWRIFGALVLIPGLVFAMLANVAMCFLRFSPLRVLTKVWDFGFGEGREIIGDDDSKDLHISGVITPDKGMRRASICGSEVISELDLDNGAEDSTMHVPATTSSADRKGLLTMLRLRKTRQYYVDG
jgi:hypothetical protein